MPNVAARVGVTAADFSLDGVEFGDALQRLAGDRRGAGSGEFVEAAAHMRPAEGEPHVALFRQRAIAGVAVDLQHALEAGQMHHRPLGLAVGRIDIGDGRRVRAAPGPIVARIGPELACLGSPAPGIEHGRRRPVGEDFGRGAQMRQQALVHGP